MTTKQKNQTTKKKTAAKNKAAKAPKESKRSARSKDPAGGTTITSEAHAKATAALLADLEKDAEKKEAAASAQTSKSVRTPKAGAAKPPKPPKAEKPKRTSLLDAAATILREAKAPLGAKAIVEQVTERGLWAPTKGGKTPHATLYAAMTREIVKKGDASRFAKAERGLFTAAASAGKGA